MSDLRLGFIGAGNMASAIIGGLVKQGFDPASIYASDPQQESLQRLSQQTGINACASNKAVVAQADVVILAVKPQVMQQVIEPLAAPLRERQPLIISIAAGITSGALERWIGAQLPIVRCMPNTPALVQTGASGLFANPAVSATQRDQADRILSAVGIVLWVEQESAIDAVTAVSGSGPAYFFLVMEAMQQAGEALGLSPEVATQLTQQTALGAARMACSSDVDAAELRRRVTSPNGTTERAIASFEAANLREIFLQALTACRDRSIDMNREISGE